MVSFYEQETDLQPAEYVLFSRYIKSGLDILDIGVGGGRTTTYLAAHAGKYVGIDYSASMVAACLRRFPNLNFLQADATDLSQFDNEMFDIVVFSFNGIDYISTDEKRATCLGEIARVLKPTGVLIFSSHNAHAIGQWPLLRGAKPHQYIWRTARAIFTSLGTAWRNFTSGAYQAGEGYVVDRVHGGLRTYVSTPKIIARQIISAGLTIDVVLDGQFPHCKPGRFTQWYYYACRKRSENQNVHRFISSTIGRNRLRGEPHNSRRET